MSNESNTLAYLNQLDSIIRHIRNVQTNCYILGKKLIELDDFDLGKNLIANSFIHDNSKFKGIEWEHLKKGDDILPEVIHHHNHTNDHHPEYWGSIQEMPRIKIAEFCCDTVSRSQEFGSDIRNWIDNIAIVKYKFTKEDKVYTDIQYFLNLLLEKPF